VATTPITECRYTPNSAAVRNSITQILGCSPTRNINPRLAGTTATATTTYAVRSQIFLSAQDTPRPALRCFSERLQLRHVSPSEGARGAPRPQPQERRTRGGHHLVLPHARFCFSGCTRTRPLPTELHLSLRRGKGTDAVTHSRGRTDRDGRASIGRYVARTSEWRSPRIGPRPRDHNVCRNK